MWRFMSGTQEYPAFANDVKVKDRIISASNMRFGGGKQRKGLGEGSRGENSRVLVDVPSA